MEWLEMAENCKVWLDLAGMAGLAGNGWKGLGLTGNA